MPRNPLDRKLQPTSIKKFKGINRFTNLAATTPEFATDLLNVILGASGGIRKARLPRDLSTVVIEGTCYGGFDYQRGDGKRQVIACYGTRIYKYEFDDATDTYIPTQIDDHPDNAYRWSMVESNNVLLMANGHRMLKWIGTGLYKWGIQTPPQPAFVDATKTRPISEAQLVSNVATYTTDDTSTLVLGDLMTIQTANPIYDLPPNQPVIDIIDGTHFSTTVINADAPLTVIPAGFFTVNGPLTLVTGRRYAASLKSSVTLHQGSISPISESSGPVYTGIITASLDDPDVLDVIANDPQIDTVVWYATIDGGTEYLLHSETSIGAGIPLLNDRKLDVDLSTLERGPLVNDPPPVGYYLHEWGGRIYIGRLDGAPQDIVYSGVEQIRVGRPEEAFPPNNRLRLGIGADDIAGLGVVQGGLIAGSKSNELFMFRGEVEDIVTGELVAYSAVLEKLPFATAFSSHYSICSTSNGLQALSSARSIDVYNGTSKPTSVSLAITDLMKKITEKAIDQCTAVFYNNVDKDWYIIAFPTNGTTYFSTIVVFDMDDEPGNSAGITLFEFGGFDAMFKCEDPRGSGETKVIIVQDGILKEFVVLSDEKNDVTQTADVNPDEDAELDAYWQGGLIGNDSSNYTKHYRKMQVVGDQKVGLNIKLYDDKEHTFDNPEIISVPENKWGGKSYSINRKARRMSPGVIFPTHDMNCAVQEIMVNFIVTGER